MRHATTSERASFDGLPGEPSLVAPTDNYQPSNDNIRCTLKPQYQTWQLPC